MRFPFSRFTVSGNSMLPTLKPDQDILVLSWFVNLKVGDLVAFKKGNRDMIKRVIKTCGQYIEVVGDNFFESTDSRNFGLIQKSQILGKVIYKS